MFPRILLPLPSSSETLIPYCKATRGQNSEDIYSDHEYSLRYSLKTLLINSIYALMFYVMNVDYAINKIME